MPHFQYSVALSFQIGVGSPARHATEMSDEEEQPERRRPRRSFALAGGLTWIALVGAAAALIGLGFWMGS